MYDKIKRIYLVSLSDLTRQSYEGITNVTSLLAIIKISFIIFNELWRPSPHDLKETIPSQSRQKLKANIGISAKQTPNTNAFGFGDLDKVPHSSCLFLLFPNEIIMRMTLEETRKRHSGDENSDLGLLHISKSYWPSCFEIKLLLAEDQTMVRDDALKYLNP